MKNFDEHVIERKALSGKGLYTHGISQGKLKESSKTWVIKEPSNSELKSAKDLELLADAEVELLAQEFFRLVIPHQPETRLLIQSTNDGRQIPYICSAMVNNYRPLPSGESEHFMDGQYTGLGQVLVTAAFVEEKDLKNVNIGLDNSNRVIKIDGDYCFSSVSTPNVDYQLTTQMIASLPCPDNFPAFNWLDYIEQGVKKPSSSIVSPNLSKDTEFRKEVNQALLKICVMSDSFIQRFVYAYKTIDPEKYIQLIKKNRDQLRIHALQDPDFKNYLQTSTAEKDANELISHMQTFVANGDIHIVVDSDQETTVHDEVIANFDNLKLTQEVYTLIVTTRSGDTLNKLHDLQKRQSGFPLSEIKEQLLDMKVELKKQLIELERKKLDKLTTNDANRTLVMANFEFINRVDSYRIDDNEQDKPIIDFCNEQRQQLKGIVNDTEKLKTMHSTLKNMYQTAEARQKNKEIILYNKNLITKIRAYNPSDDMLCKFCNEQEKKLQQISSLTTLSAMQTELSVKYTEQKNAYMADVANNESLLDQIYDARINDNDDVLIAFHDTQTKELQNLSITPNKNKLLAMQQELEAVLKSVTSPEVLMVKKAVKTFRDSYISKESKQQKAQDIEEALISIPVKRRKNVISGPENPVQYELARHRKNNTVHLVPGTGGAIDKEKAAKAFKRLKDEIKKLPKPSPENTVEQTQADIPNPTKR